jgi:predicted DNA-binding transcriptional regulator AlpA
MEQETEYLIDRCEMARRLGMKTPATVDRMSRDGRLPPPIRVGKRALRWYWPEVLTALKAPSPVTTPKP